MAATILLYSKYSPFSKKIMDLIQKSAVDFGNLYSLKLLCVDNENVRNYIANNKKIPIEFVPTVLVIFPDGIVEKYEGSNALNWAESIISRHAPTLPPPSAMPQTRLRDIEGDEEAPPQDRRPSKIRPKTKPKPAKKRKPPPAPAVDEDEEDQGPPAQRTSIEDLDVEDYDTESEPEGEGEDEGDGDLPEKTSLSSIKSGRRWEPKENWSPFGRGGGKGQPQAARARPQPGIRQANGKVNVSSIMAQAQAMQRQRDTIDQVPPVGQIPPRGGRRA